MHDMALPVSFRWDEAFVKRIDEARGDVPRSVFVRRAVERALGGTVKDSSGVDRAEPPAPAQQLGPLPAAIPQQRYRPQPGPDVRNIRSSQQARASVRPIPKRSL
jgi:hypothetical protein